MGFLSSSDGKESAWNTGDLEDPLETGTPLQNSCLENPMDWGVWQATVHGVAKRWTRLSEFHFCRGFLRTTCNWRKNTDLEFLQPGFYFWFAAIAICSCVALNLTSGSQFPPLWNEVRPVTSIVFTSSKIF